MRQPYSVNVVLYRQAKTEVEFLILKRTSRASLNMVAFWQFITGALEDNETFEQSAIREVFEETGILLDRVKYAHLEYRFPIKKAWRTLYGYGPDYIVERVYYAPINKPPILSEEHSEFRWTALDETLDLIRYDTSKKALIAVNQLIETSCPP